MTYDDTCQGAARRSAPRSLKDLISGSKQISVALLILLLGAWEAAARFGLVPPFLIPAPSAVASTFFTDMTSPAVWHDFTITLTEVLVGFAVAAVTGIALGSLMALLPVFEEILTPYVTALQTIPKVAIAPLLIIWFGFGITSKVVIVALIAFFPILVNTIAGLKGVDERQLLLMRSMEASAAQTFLKIRIPAAMPFLMAGFQIALIFSVIGAIVGEFLGASEGLGSLIVRRQGMMDVEGVFSVLLILTLLGLVLDRILKIISARLTFWTTRVKDPGS